MQVRATDSCAVNSVPFGWPRCARSFHAPHAVAEGEADDAAADVGVGVGDLKLRCGVRGWWHDDDRAGCTTRHVRGDASEQGRARAMVPDNDEGRLPVACKFDEAV